MAEVTEPDETWVDVEAVATWVEEEEAVVVVAWAVEAEADIMVNKRLIFF
jgi:hypothetical protein